MLTPTFPCYRDFCMYVRIYYTAIIIIIIIIIIILLLSYKELSNYRFRVR